MSATIQGIKQRFGIIGNSELLQRALGIAQRVANTDLTVLIQGESGVGKEVFSKIIHQLSARKHNNFIAINCGAIPAGTINSELFGHEKGAFTGATSDRKGYFEVTDTGTIFLDEIGEMPLDTQSYLLRILENGEFMRVGSSKVLKTDVRIVAATNKDLSKQIGKGKFREDLFYRLNTVPIYVPALHERKEDIYLLFRKFAIDFAEKYRSDPAMLDKEARAMIDNYRWPGNIRELKNTVEQLSILTEEKLISAAELLSIIPSIGDRNLPMLADDESVKDSFQEREILYKLLFDMKADMNDLKQLVFELIKSNDLTISNGQALNYINSPETRTEKYRPEPYREFEPNVTPGFRDIDAVNTGNKAVIIDKFDSRYEETEEVEESLSIEDMEKTLIKKALKKHSNRRKDAAQDLGISERTLYRKIKQYDLG